MPATATALQKRYDACRIDCPWYQGSAVSSLGEFLNVFASLLGPSKAFWFRGHSRVEYGLTPSALRYSRIKKRERALGLMVEMRRFLEMKLPRPPEVDDDLGWMQVAQHYGLPTRLLDWTENAAVALFFACFEKQDQDGLVVALKPTDLNLQVDSKSPRLFNSQTDAGIIRPYFELGGSIQTGGLPTIAISPAWNTERIAMQHGAFTLHGSLKLALDHTQAASLVYVPILKEHKAALLNELERVGIGEMFIFPEPEHVCSHLRRGEGL